MKRKFRLGSIFITALIAVILLSSVACDSFDKSGSDKPFKAGVPDSLAGRWKCEETASDNKTATGFYEMRIEKDGEFSLYDVAAGNPGISGKMGNYTESTVECRFDMDDFDPPFCWTVSSSKATLDYEIDGKTLKLGHNGIWLIFHYKGEE